MDLHPCQASHECHYKLMNLINNHYTEYSQLKSFLESLRNSTSASLIYKSGTPRASIMDRTCQCMLVVTRDGIQQKSHVQLYCCVTFAMHGMGEYTDFKAWYLWTVVYQVQQKNKLSLLSWWVS